MSYRRILQLLVVCFTVVTGSCAQIPVPIVPHHELRQSLLQRSNMLSPNSEQLIAINLVDVLAQIQGVQPGQVKLNLAGADDEFTQHLYEILSGVGYSVKRHTDSREFVEIRVSVTPTRLNASLSDEQVNTYLIEIGNVKIKRDYSINHGLVIPRSPLFLLGTDSSQIALNDANLFSSEAQLEQVSGSNTGLTQAGITRPAVPAAHQSAGNVVKTAGNGPDTPVIEYASETSAPLMLRTDRGKDDIAYQQGEAIVMYARVHEDAWLHCYYQDGDGNVAKIFPNRFTQGNVVAGGQEIRIPATDKWQLLATRPGEKERFLCVVVDTDSEHFAELEQIPDLQPLQIEDLEQVYQQYSLVVGTDLINQTLEVSVN